MSFAYFDTSALVKRYVRERGSTQVISLLRHHEVLTSAITPVEIRSALCRRKRSGDLSETEFDLLLDRIQLERATWELVECGTAILKRAEEIIEEPALMRALDAIHVASVLGFQTAASTQVPLITGDFRQRDAARHFGLEVVWVA